MRKKIIIAAFVVQAIFLAGPELASSGYVGGVIGVSDAKLCDLVVGYSKPHGEMGARVVIGRVDFKVDA